DSSIGPLLSTPVIRPAGGTNASEAAPPPQPTSSTWPPAGSASSARWRDGVSAAWSGATNRPGGNDQGDSGAAARISSGMAHDANAAAHASAHASAVEGSEHLDAGGGDEQRVLELGGARAVVGDSCPAVVP